MAAQLTAPPVVRRHAVFHDLRVAEVAPLTADSVTITFAVPAELAEEYSFVQGQHVSLRCRPAGDEVRRNYSICSPVGSGLLRVAVKKLPGGVFSSYAHGQLRAGDVIEVLTPTGRFNTPLDVDAARTYVAIAAGSGITPILSIIATILEVEPRSSVTLLYGNRTMQDIMFLEDLEDLKNRALNRFSMSCVLSREQQEAELLNGRIDRAKLERFCTTILPAAVDEWFICGPQAMINEARAFLAERGVDSRHVHAELFHAQGQERPAEAAPQRGGVADGAAQVTVVLDGRASTFALDPNGERILDAALRVRSDAPFACKGGVCGTCRARVLQGAVTMEQNYALEQSEVDAGFVLACQSHPAAAAVTLDFDQ
ncbi:MAG TPA: 1,2-phenylacetyl-CoA epoxidase subunit PaaE [Candidatus Dormibacteraeota bacterium]